MFDVGFKNYIDSKRIVSIISPNSTKAKRLIKEAVLGRKLVNCTHGRKTGALIFLNTYHLILSSLKHKTLVKKLGLGENKKA